MKQKIIKCEIPYTAFKAPHTVPMIEEDRETIRRWWKKAGFQFNSKTGQGKNGQTIESPGFNQESKMFIFRQYLKP